MLRQLLYNRSVRRPASYSVLYQVSAPKAGNVVLPCPTSTDYQTVEPKTDYLHFTITEPTVLSWTGTVSVQPRRPHYPQTHMIADYTTQQNAEACLPDDFVQPTLPAISGIIKQFNVIPTTSVIDLVQRLYQHAITTLRYGNPIPGLYTTTDALTQPAVDCGGFDTYLAALLRACGIPARLIAGFWAGHRSNDMHAWLEFRLPTGEWVPLDPSVEQLRNLKRSTKLGGFGEVGSDRIVTNVGSNRIIRFNQQEYKLGILQTPVYLLDDGQIEFIPDYQVLTS